MSLYQKPGTPFWYFSKVDPATGKLVRQSTKETNKRAAEKHLERWLQDRRAASVVAADGRQEVTLAEALESYRDSLEGRPGRKTVVTMMNRLLGKVAGRAPLDAERISDLDSGKLEALRRGRLKEGAAPGTIRLELRTLRTAIGYAVEFHRAREPKAKLRWPVVKADVKTRSLSWEEFEKLYEYLDPDREVKRPRPDGSITVYQRAGIMRAWRQDVRDLTVALLMTGGRWQEVAGLTWNDVQGEFLTIQGLKTNKIRTVGAPPQVTEMLQRRLVERKPGELYVFPGRFGGRRSAVLRPVLRAMNELGFNRPDIVAKHGKCVVHSLRHTFATWLIDQGMDIKAVSVAMGHSTVKMTERYAHPDALKIAQRIAGAMSGVVGVGTLGPYAQGD